jgi:hypothetical protein
MFAVSYRMVAVCCAIQNKTVNSYVIEMKRTSALSSLWCPKGASLGFRNQMPPKVLVRHHRLLLWPIPVTEREPCSRRTLGKHHMPQSLKTDSGLIDIERPPCPKCHRPMTFVELVLGKDGIATRTFECALCRCTEKVSVKIGST